MNKTNLKRYAPEARKDFIAAVTARAHLLGLSERAGKPHAEPCEVKGDVALIGGRPWPANVQGRRDALLNRMQRDGFAHTLEAAAYTWFNRLAALRYMELHDYLGHGRRVLSNPVGGLPEVLTHAVTLAESGELPGLLPANVRTLKLNNQDGELYRSVLIAQCNALHRAMPFLFEAIDDETELLLPDNLLLSDSLVAKLVAEIPEEDWTDVEAIGWLYQFYISEKKNEVIGKVVQSEDIPAATQLFTPNWIVQYLVQNSVGGLWLMANPSSTLASHWPYYIQPAVQTPAVQAQLDALIQTRICEDGEALNPETITVLDPACGSGHILVVAYDVLKAIYLERGYQPRAIPRLILEKNLYGLDIDDRAAQLAAFALLMKARADDRRLFNDPPKINVLSLQESKGLVLDEIDTHLAPHGLRRATLKTLLHTFEHAKTLGSLIHIPETLNGQLLAITDGLKLALGDGDMYAQQAAKDMLPLVEQARVLAMRFDAVVANPPYMGSKGFVPILKGYANNTYPDTKSDLFAMFMERGFSWCGPLGFNSMVTMQSWMFLSSYEDFRERLLQHRTIHTMAHLGPRAFNEISGEVVQTTASVFQRQHLSNFRPVFFRLISGQDVDKQTALRSGKNRFDTTVQDDFATIPGSPLAYWPSMAMRTAFKAHKTLGEIAKPREGLNTTDNDRFLRRWWECNLATTNFGARSANDASSSGATWFPCQKGGSYRKWFGNHEYLVNWKNGGVEIKKTVVARYGSASKRVVNEHLYFSEGITWSSISSSSLSLRYVPSGFIFETKGNMCFFETKRELLKGLGFLNSCVVNPMIQCVSPTLDFHAGPVGKLPVATDVDDSAILVAQNAVRTTEEDWDAFERSWNFKRSPLLPEPGEPAQNIQASYAAWVSRNRDTVAEMQRIEEQNNRLFIEAYSLAGELAPGVPIEQITLTVNPAYRYGAPLIGDEQWNRFRRDAMEELVSYTIGCMMGRYSLDQPGLIYAHAGSVEFDPSRYAAFQADADGILPVTEQRWFEDDAASRVREFLRVAWGAETLDENMAWLAASLGTKGSESSDEAIRRYLADRFFKDHLQTYRKRPIYWLFSSGRQGAFQALIYLHRYHEGTLARLRSAYVVPLTGKMQERIERMEADIRAASTTASRSKLTKQSEALKKQYLELLAYDEKLRHYADMRISLNLDDGVKVNYGKFGDLLAEAKAVTGGTSDDD